MTDEEYIKMQEAAQSEHRKAMQRYKARLLTYEAIAAALLYQLIHWIMEHFA